MTYIPNHLFRKKSKIFLVLIILFIGTSAVTVDKDKYFEIAKNLEIFTNVYKELNTHYVDELDPNQLMRTGIDAIMNSLDPYTVYYSEAQVESYRISTEGRYNGLGANSRNVDGKVTITEVYKNGPSHKAGLQAGDQIVEINGKTTEGKSYDEVVQFIRGFPGTKINLGIYRPAENNTMNYTLTRGEVDIPNVPYAGMVNDHIGYIALTTFTRNAGKNIARELRTLREENDLRGLILDLRGNGGGLLSEAVDILGIFLPVGSPVVSTQGKVRDRDQNYQTRRMPVDTDLPLAVLVNKSSASASEIVSGSIQDYDRGVIMGQRTYGKGLVQNHQEVGYNSRIKVTISKYYIPSGRCIQSVEYENGEPKDIPDAEREVFYTQNGRPVLAGGGVTPDVKISPAPNPPVMKTLIDDNWIFKFANEYFHDHQEAPNLDTWEFNDFEQFSQYLTAADFSFETPEEIALASLSELNDEEGLDEEIESIRKKLSVLKADDLDQYSENIVDMLEIELAHRYYFEEGKIRQNLKNDKEIDQAVVLLSNPDKYYEILK